MHKTQLKKKAQHYTVPCEKSELKLIGIKKLFNTVRGE